MAMRFGPGPVFAVEWLTASRRWQGYATRAAFVAVLMAGMGVACLAEWRGAGAAGWGPNRMASVGRATTIAIVGTQLALVLMIAPASTAGAVCSDRASGALTQLLTTDLSASEVVLGKLLARLVPVFGLVLCGLPVAMLATLLGGADPDAMLRAAAVTLAVAVLGGAAGMLTSAWAGRTQEALMAVYLAWAAWMLVGPALGAFVPVPSRVEMLHPFLLVLAPFGASGRGGWGDVLVFVAAVVPVAALLTALAIASVRPAERRGTGVGAGRARASRLGTSRLARVIATARRLAPGPSLDGNPVLWREWHRRRPSRWGRAIWWTYGLASAAFTAVALGAVLESSNPPDPGMFVILGVGFQASIGLLLLGVSASTSLAEERERGSLDVLMASPLRSAAIVWGKWWGAARPLPAIALPTVLIATAAASRTGGWLGPALAGTMMLAYGAAVVSLGVAMATQARRTAWAVTLTVTLYLLPTAAWFFLLLALANGEEYGAALAVGSPFYGPILGLLLASHPDFAEFARMAPAALAAWAFAYGSAAVLLQASTLMGFDRRLGRMPEGTNPGPSGPPRRGTPSRRGRAQVS